VAGALFQATLLAVIVLAVARVGAPFGTVALMLGLAAVLTAIGTGDWRFVPAAVGSGLLVDVLARLAPARLKAPLIGSGAAAALILAPSLTILLTTALAWSPTLTLGATLAAAGIGAGLSGLIAPVAARPDPIDE
jgi:hypothetical protein